MPTSGTVVMSVGLVHHGAMRCLPSGLEVVTTKAGIHPKRINVQIAPPEPIARMTQTDIFVLLDRKLLRRKKMGSIANVRSLVEDFNECSDTVKLWMCCVTL